LTTKRPLEIRLFIGAGTAGMRSLNGEKRTNGGELAVKDGYTAQVHPQARV